MRTQEDKIRIKFQNKITQKQTALNLNYDILIKTAEANVRDKLTTKKNRQLEKYIKLQERNRDRELKNLHRKQSGKKTHVYKKPIADRLIPQKTHVLDLCQLLARVRDANVDGYVIGISDGKIYKRDECCGGHYHTRTNNATAFDMDNIHAQSAADNASMNYGGVEGKRVEDKFRNALILKLGAIRFQELEMKIQNTLHTPNKIPPKRRLEEIRDYTIEKIKEEASNKNLHPKAGSLLSKVLAYRLQPGT